MVGLAHRVEALDQWSAEAGGETAALAADLSAEADVAALAARASEPFGPPDILVNAAGLNLRQPADQVTREGWERTIALNLMVPFFLAQTLVPAMREKRWGRLTQTKPPPGNPGRFRVFSPLSVARATFALNAGV